MSENVKKDRADIGFAFDGDADRLVVVDENGAVIDGDKLLGALALYLKNSKSLKGDGFVATHMSNKALEDFANTNEMKLHRCNVGDKYVLEVLKNEGINFGGEQSGHIIFSDFAKTGDALVASLQVMANLLTTKKKASMILNPFELYPQILKNIKIDKKVPFAKI